MLIWLYAFEDFDFQAIAFGFTRTRPTTPSASRIVNSWLVGVAKDFAPLETVAFGLAAAFAFVLAAALGAAFALATVLVVLAEVFAFAAVFGFAVALDFGFAAVFGLAAALATVFGLVAVFALAAVFGLAATFAAVFVFALAAALAGFFAVLVAIVWAPLSINFRQLDCFQFVDTSFLRRNVAKILQGWCLFVAFREGFSTGRRY